jgi:hypothetical protein
MSDALLVTETGPQTLPPSKERIKCSHPGCITLVRGENEIEGKCYLHKKTKGGAS